MENNESRMKELTIKKEELENKISNSSNVREKIALECALSKVKESLSTITLSKFFR